ncbi:MAG: hypothetical protein RLZZ194_723 [Actinomycetota bacterium]
MESLSSASENHRSSFAVVFPVGNWMIRPVERWGIKKNVDKWASRSGLMSLTQFKIGECAVA